MTVLIIDNIDSFVYNLYQYVGELGAEGLVRRNDVSLKEVGKIDPDSILISPGPGTPEKAGCSVSVIRELGETTPILGVCLGHQALAKFFGLPVVLQDTSTQGVQKQIQVFGRDYKVGFYNSFSPEMADNHKAPATIHFDVDAKNRILAMKGDGFISFQFHPESVLSEKGYELLTESLITLRLQRI